MDAVMQAKIRAFDEFTSTFRKYKNELKNLEGAQNDVTRATERSNKATNEFFNTLGNVGALYAFARGVRDIATVGGDLEAQLMRVSAMTGENIEKFERMAKLSATGIFGPRELAKGFIDIAAAGFGAKDIELMYKNIERLAVGGMVDFGTALEPTINLLKTYNLEAQQSAHVADAFVEAANRSALQVEDLNLALAMSSGVAKMAGMDWHELIGVLGILRDSGLKASDAGTSIKSALLALMNPSNEAAQVMKILGINIYDAQGKMNSWADIVDQFAQKTVNMTEEARNFALSTVFGSDGVRAMALSMNRGGQAIKEITQGLREADGAADDLAGRMKGAFNNAWREFTVELEKVKDLIFEDLAPALMMAARGLRDLGQFLQGVPDPVRKFAYTLLGAGGLLSAITLTHQAMKTMVGIDMVKFFTGGAAAARTAALTFSQATGPVTALTFAITGLAVAFSSLAKARMDELEARNKAEIEAYGQDPRAVFPKALKRPGGGVPPGADAGKAFMAYVDLLNKSKEIKDPIAQNIIANPNYIPPGENQGLMDLEKFLKKLEEASKKGKKGSLDQKNEAEEAAKKAIEGLTNALYPYRKASEDAARAVDLLAAKEQFLANAVQNGTATAGQALELDKLRRWQVHQLTEQQKALHAENEKQKAVLASVQKAYKAASDPKAAAVLRDEIDRLNQSIAQNSQAWWQAEMAKAQAFQATNDLAYQKATDLMRHQVAMGRMSTDQQIAFLEKLRAAHSWTQGQMWEIEENLYRLRREQLNSYLNQMDKAYKDKLDTLEEDIKAKIKDLQDQIKAIDEEGQAADREEALRKHNQRLQELQEKRRYHELRTGKEHQQAIAEIDKEIAEENHQWQLQQDQWLRDDKKANLQKQIEDAQEAAEKERKALQDHYEKAKGIAESGILDTISALAATAPEWFDTGKVLINQLIAGLESGDFTKVSEIISNVKSSTPQPGTIPWQTVYNTNKDIWERDSKLPGVNPGDKNTWTPAMITAHKENEKLRQKYGITDTGKIPGYLHGGPIRKTGPAIVHEGEYMIPANLVQAIRNGAPPPSRLDWAGNSGGGSAAAIDRAANKIIGAIITYAGVTVNGPVWQTEAVYMGDQTIPELTGRQLLKGLKSAARRRGSQ